MNLMWIAATCFLIGAIYNFATGNTALGSANVALAAAFFAIGQTQRSDETD
jgi:hypothetical protein